MGHHEGWCTVVWRMQSTRGECVCLQRGEIQQQRVVVMTTNWDGHTPVCLPISWRDLCQVRQPRSNEIQRLSFTYNILTWHTSYIVIPHLKMRACDWSDNISQTSGKQFPIVTSTLVTICILGLSGLFLLHCCKFSFCVCFCTVFSCFNILLCVFVLPSGIIKIDWLIV